MDARWDIIKILINLWWSHFFSLSLIFASSSPRRSRWKHFFLIHFYAPQAASTSWIKSPVAFLLEFAFFSLFSDIFWPFFVVDGNIFGFSFLIFLKSKMVVWNIRELTNINLIFMIFLCNFQCWRYFFSSRIARIVGCPDNK